ncbi:MurR/RpiR family transcriptional regulator [Amphibacillus jilinensis]|uniref:MurR/RpiR family transcriptional regulator n=1 Tax=Amphibacillus jilinensis TaxID=1216008 RepID=UPI000301E791|nr:MurR/RpiR family transcriptional regulator [Amphibacillus jilinensis]
MLKDLINTHYDQLSDNDFYVLDFVQSHHAQCSSMTINELSNACSISKSSILRLSQKLGFSGYSEFKFSLKREIQNVDKSSDFYALSHKDIQFTEQLYNKIDKNPIFNGIDKADSIYGFATGWGQRNALEELSRYLISCGKPMHIIPAATELNIVLSKIKPTDLVIFISLSGDVENIITVLKSLAIRAIPTLSITSFKNNHLAELSHYHLYYQSTDLGTYYGVEQKSFIGLQVMIDLLFRGFLQYRKNLKNGDGKD